MKKTVVKKVEQTKKDAIKKAEPTKDNTKKDATKKAEPTKDNTKKDATKKAEPTKDNTKKSNNKKTIVITSIVVVILAIIAAVFFFIFSKNKSITETSPKENKQTSIETSTDGAIKEKKKDLHAGMVKSTMTGTWIKKNVSKKRPFAIMINNIEYAFNNQSGTSKADILYEALAEGGITRMEAIYQDVSKVKKICSIRSARHYYVQFAYEWDAIFCHFGHTKYAVKKMKELKTQNLSGLSGIGPVVYKRNSLKPPHNVFTNGKKMLKGAKKLKYPINKRKKSVAEHFNFNDKDTSISDGKKAKNVVIPFSFYSTCKLKYNTKKKTYFKYEYNKKHMDKFYHKQLNFKNVIIQLVKEKNKDHNGYQTMAIDDNTGDGYYLTNGKYKKIHWERCEADNTMRYYDDDDETISINPGKTYIAVYPTKRKKMLKFK